MRFNFRNASLLSVLMALSFTGPMLRAQTKQPMKTKTLGVQVKMIRSDEITLPAEFQVSLYENLIDQLQKKAVFQRVYRDGDQAANNGDDLITLQCSVVKFKKGSETLRAVTTVAGATSMTLRCQFMDKAGNTVLVRDITGKVRLFGGNLKATYDFAKKAAKVADENFSSVAARS
jgi:Domain of unknown function (DUF4410)